ncbi:MAG: MFS transporter [Promethearchaeota archaeon]
MEQQNEKKKITYTKQYIYYSLFVMGLINLVDIFTSNAGPLIVSYVVDEFLISRGVPANVAYAQYGALGSIGLIFGFISLSIKYIADKFGRKKALIVNVLGMSIGAILVIFATDILSYMLGTWIGNLFLAADIQLLLISEEAPKEKRQIFNMIVMIVGLIGAILVLVFRELFLPNWRILFYLPLIAGIIVTVLIIFTLKESSVYLTMKANKAAQLKDQATKEKSENIFKIIFKLKNFKMILLVFFVGFLGQMAGMTFRSYWQPFLSQTYDLSQVNIIYLIRYVLSIFWGLLIGFISDKFGRKRALITQLTTLPLCLILSIYFVSLGTAYIILVGITYAIFIYSLWTTGTTTTTMIFELTPTEARASVQIITTAIGIVLFLIVTVLFAVFLLWIDFATLFLIAVIPGSIIAIIITLIKLPETKATDLTEVKR